MRRLIVNADDLGLTAGVNHGTLQSHRQGIVTSATLMANSAAFDHAVGLAQREKGFGVGCHVVLLDGDLLTAASSLAPGGRTRRSIREFAQAAVMDKLRADEIEAEALAQLRKVQAAGISVTHFDSHKHAHIFPAVLRPMLSAAKQAGVRAVRNPFENLAAQKTGDLLRAGFARFAEVKALSVFAGAWKKLVRDSGLETTDGCFGVVATGSLDEASLLAIADAVPEGTWELVCHPGVHDAELEAAHTRLLQSREVEMEALISSRVRERLAQRNVELVHFGEL